MFNLLNKFLSISDLNSDAKRFISKAVSIMFVFVFVIMLTNTFLILFALEYLNISELGIVLAIQFAVQAISDYPTGAIGDWIGQRWVLFVASLSYGVGFFFLSLTQDFSGILISFSLIAFAQGQESGTFVSWFDNNYKLYAIEDKDRRIYSQFFGKFTMFYEIITAFSFILGGMIIVYSNRQHLFLVQAILLVFLSILFLVYIRDHKNIKRDKPNFKAYYRFLEDGIKTVIQNKTLRLMVLGLVISGAGFATWSGLILFPMYEEYGQSDEWTAILRATVFIFGAVMVGLAGITSKKIFNLQKWLSLAIISTDILFFIGMFIMLTFFPAPSNFALVSLAIVIFSFTFAFFPRFFADVLKPRFFLDVIPDKNRNAIYSLIPTLVLLVSIFFVSIGGILIETFGRKTVILILAVNGLIGSSITAYAIFKHKVIDV
ncbi:MAG: MFS transporter, partial [Candidatus Hodarchaeales archaeon]